MLLSSEYNYVLSLKKGFLRENIQFEILFYEYYLKLNIFHSQMKYEKNILEIVCKNMYSC